MNHRDTETQRPRRRTKQDKEFDAFQERALYRASSGLVWTADDYAMVTRLISEICALQVKVGVWEDQLKRRAG